MGEVDDNKIGNERAALRELDVAKPTRPVGGADRNVAGQVSRQVVAAMTSCGP
jgi:hypothetical protein